MDSLISSSGSLKSSGTTNRPSQLPAFGTPVTGRTWPRRTLSELRDGNEPCDRPVVFGDRHAFTGGETMNKFREVGLCLLEGDCRHPEVSYGSVVVSNILPDSEPVATNAAVPLASHAVAASIRW